MCHVTYACHVGGDLTNPAMVLDRAAPAGLLRFALLVATAASSPCTKSTAHNGTAFDLSGCTELDLSCPTEGTRSVACSNALLPSELKDLARALANDQVSGTLETISFRGSPLGANGATILAPALAACASLHTIGLGSTRIGDAGLRTVAQAVLQPPAASAIKHLDVSHNTIGDDGVRALVTVLKAAGVTLAALDLSWNAIGTRGGRYLAEALKDSTVGSLAELRVSWNGLGDRGARALGDSLGSNSVLSLLDLQHNAIKDEGGKAIAKGLRANGALKTLLLDHNGISNATRQEATEALAAEPAQKAPDAPGSSGGGARSVPGTRSALEEDEEEIEEISFDDDVESTAEAAAEEAAELRESVERANERAAKAEAAARAAQGGPCVDGGPWTCAEDNCPADPMTCEHLAGLSLCANTFAEVWDTPPEEVGGAQLISTLCPSSCKLCKEKVDAREL